MEYMDEHRSLTPFPLFSLFSTIRNAGTVKMRVAGSVSEPPARRRGTTIGNAAVTKDGMLTFPCSHSDFFQLLSFFFAFRIKETHVNAIIFGTYHSLGCSFPTGNTKGNKSMRVALI